jgi:SAM-dependent methyltransferase
MGVLSRTYRRVVWLACVAGVNPHQVRSFVRRLPRYLREARAYRRTRPAEFPLVRREMVPILVDYDAAAGVASGHYFHQDLWAARLIHARRPARHVDIGSRVDGFVAHLLTFMPVTVLDVRPLESDIDGLSFEQGDITRLDRFPADSIESLSSLHAVEHVGLGRYGDAIDPDGWRKAVAELTRVLEPGGRLYFSVPIGRERVRFNADRFFHASTIVRAFARLRLVSHAAVDDAGRLMKDPPLSAFDHAEDSCGLFEFTKD